MIRRNNFRAFLANFLVQIFLRKLGAFVGLRDSMRTVRSMHSYHVASAQSARYKLTSRLCKGHAENRTYCSNRGSYEGMIAVSRDASNLMGFPYDLSDLVECRI